jgi:hypothetical protein
MQDYLVSHRDIQDVIFIPGQGINAEERSFILSNNPQEISSDLIEHITQQCRSSVHKSKQQNVVISRLTPTIKKDLTYKASLIVDNENELILDHVSGYHVPGMIFIEATRQLAMAALSLVEGESSASKALIMKDIKASYLIFAYLIPTLVTTRLEPICDGEYSIFCEFTQNKDIVVRTNGSFKVSDKDKLQRLEALLMKKNITLYLNEIQAQLKKSDVLEETFA